MSNAPLIFRVTKTILEAINIASNTKENFLDML